MKKNAAPQEWRCGGPIVQSTVSRPESYLKNLLFALLLGLLGAALPLQAQTNVDNITHIYTDYLGFWSSGVGNLNPVRPDYSHNLLAFIYKNQTYSTGVNDELLNAYGVTFRAMEYQALPVLNMPITSGVSRFAQFGEMQDGLHIRIEDGEPPFSYRLPISLSDMLTDGEQGLDISTGITNMLADDGSLVEMEFQFTAIEEPGELSNGLPDILVSQIAQPITANPDELWFADAEGNMVGNVITIVQTQLPILGTSMNDFIDPNDGTHTSPYVNSSREIRISAYDGVEFGLTSENYHQAQKLIYKMGGNSDPAFLAFNTNLIKVLVANNDKVTTVANTSGVSIAVKNNDLIPEAVTLKAPTVAPEHLPEHGTITINANHTITYVPNTDFTGVDSFRYTLCSTTESCDIATVSITVGASDVEISKTMDNTAPNIGETVTFTVEVSNTGQYELYDALNTRVIDVLPSGYTYISSEVSAGSYSPLTGYWAVGTLTAGATQTLTLVAKVNESGEYTNTAEVSSAMFDPDLSNNTASVTPKNFLSANLSVGCQQNGEYQQIQIELTGEQNWELTYSFNGEEITESGITSSTFLIKPEEKGVFRLLSVKDVYENGRYNREINFSSSPSTRSRIYACKTLINPALPTKAVRL